MSTVVVDTDDESLVDRISAVINATDELVIPMPVADTIARAVLTELERSS